MKRINPLDQAITEVLENIRIIADSKSAHGAKITRNDINNIVHNVCDKYKVNDFSVMYSMGLA